jgi:hypothetical protein
MANSEFSITGANGKWMRELFFYLGLIGAIGLRIVLILNNYNPLYSKIIWYIAMLSLTAFYYYRRWIERKRRKIIVDGDLLEKINKNNLDSTDRKKILTLLGSTIVSKQMLNLDILFLASIAALIIQMVIDFKLKL